MRSYSAYKSRNRCFQTIGVASRPSASGSTRQGCLHQLHLPPVDDSLGHADRMAGR